MNNNEMMPNRLLLFPIRITIHRDVNQDHTQEINIHVRNTLHVHLPPSNTDDPTNMVIHHQHSSNADNSDSSSDSDSDADDDTCVGSSQDTTASSSSGHSQRSPIYATPPYSSQSKSAESSSTP